MLSLNATAASSSLSATTGHSAGNHRADHVSYFQFFLSPFSCASDFYLPIHFSFNVRFHFCQAFLLVLLPFQIADISPLLIIAHTIIKQGTPYYRQMDAKVQPARVDSSTQTVFALDGSKKDREREDKKKGKGSLMLDESDGRPLPYQLGSVSVGKGEHGSAQEQRKALMRDVRKFLKIRGDNRVCLLLDFLLLWREI